MSLERLREEGLKWVEANKSKRFSGVTKLLTDLYPDNAHFIYELLQNAEDARDKNIPNSSGASVVRFALSGDALEFEHNGEGLFTLEDVGRITGIGDSGKRDDPTSIGKFGIGFKAVFAYTNTPEIHSGGFHFRIHDLVVPETNGVAKPRMSEQETRFIFPFDNPKKPSKQAVAEIEQGLRALGDNTLLFLSHIRKIEYLLPDGSLGIMELIDHDGGHIEIRTGHPGGNISTSHWLRFQKDVEVEDEVLGEDGDIKFEVKSCRIAIAYSLVEEEDKKKKCFNWKIDHLDCGQVSIYFPAVAAISNLRFHLHAPFASTVARDTVRECKANYQLRDHLAELVVESLVSIRDQGMLTVGFLSVLPNLTDNLYPFYEPIRKAIVHAFKNESFTPTRSGRHAPSTMLYKGPSDIAKVLDDQDLALLLSNERVPPLWAANPPPDSQREENFLKSLNVAVWGWDELTNAFNAFLFLDDEERDRVEKWIWQKDDAWLMRFYALLGEACDSHNKYVFVDDLKIVRVVAKQGNEHITPKEVFFPPEEEAHTPNGIFFVKPTVYNTGRSELQKKNAASFLAEIGVRHFDAKAAIELRLTFYNTLPDQASSSHFKDMEMFVDFWKKNPAETRMFTCYAFLRGVSESGNLHWCKPAQVCLDVPYIDTGLAQLLEIHKKYILWDGYQSKLNESQLKDFTAFVKAIGAFHELKVEECKTLGNPKVSALQNFPHSARTRDSGTDSDYSIARLNIYLHPKSISASRLIWNALIKADAKSARARYSPNQQYRPHDEESQLVYLLKRNAWIPDKSGEFHKPQDVAKDDLRADFVPDERNGLLAAIGFGENARKRSEEYRARNQEAQNLGFSSLAVAEAWANLSRSGANPDDVRVFLANSKQVQPPEEAVGNPEKRKKGVVERRENAPSKESVSRERSIQPGARQETLEAKAYLRAKYTNPDEQLICQCCHNEMPFKVSDSHYFEAIQCVRGLNQHHFENRLALCPLCAAMYQHARESNDIEIRRRIVENDAPDTASSVGISVKLAGQDFQLHFVGTHWFDLKTILSG